MLDPFACGLHTNISLHVYLYFFLAILLIDVGTFFKKIIPIFPLLKYGKIYNSSGYEEDYSCELPNFELKFFGGPLDKRFANLSKQEFNKLVKQKHSDIDQKNNKLVCLNISR